MASTTPSTPDHDERNEALLISPSPRHDDADGSSNDDNSAASSYHVTDEMSNDEESIHSGMESDANVQHGEKTQIRSYLIAACLLIIPLVATTFVFRPMSYVKLSTNTMPPPPPLSVFSLTTTLFGDSSGTAVTKSRCEKGQISRPSSNDLDVNYEGRTPKAVSMSTLPSIEDGSVFQNYLEGLATMVAELGKAPHCQINFPYTIHWEHINYATLTMYDYGNQAGVYYCYPQGNGGPLRWRDLVDKDKWHTSHTGKSGRTTEAESYYCKRFVCDEDESQLCTRTDEDKKNDDGDKEVCDEGSNQDKKNDDGEGEEEEEDDGICTPLCIMVYKLDHSMPSTRAPIDEFYKSASKRYGLGIGEVETITDTDALMGEGKTGGISYFYRVELEMFNGPDMNSPFAGGRNVEAKQRGFILNGVESGFQIMMLKKHVSHSGMVHEGLHSPYIQRLHNQRNRIEEDHAKHIQKISKIILRPDSRFPLPQSLKEVTFTHGIDSSSWKPDYPWMMKEKNLPDNFKFHAITPIMYDYHHGRKSYENGKVIDLYGDKVADVANPGKAYNVDDHKKAFEQLLKNIEKCTAPTGDDRFKTVIFCRYDDNNSVLFKALTTNPNLKHLVEDIADIETPDNRMMTKLLIGKLGATPYHYFEGLTYLCE